MDVVVVTFNAREHLRACLASVQREGANAVVVIDTSSTDGSADMVLAEYPWARLVRSPNRGYGAAANAALAETSCDYLLLLNSDTVIRAGCVLTLGEYLDANPRVALVGPKLLNPDGTLQPSCYPFLTPFRVLLTMTPLNQLIGRVRMLRELHLPTSSHNRARSVPWLKGAALAIRRDALTAVGGFDESYFMYYEELDVCYRLRAAGWQVHFTPAATVVHVGGASTGQQRARMKMRLYSSLRHFYERHYSTRRVVALRLMLAAVMAARLVRDSVRLRGASDEPRRSALEEDLSIWRETLLDSLPSGSGSTRRRRADDRFPAGPEAE